jgi:hypothetical protein
MLLCFLDCYSGYHQIALKEEDQIKTAFITPFGTYAYKTMSFGLKNAGATYQRMIQMCFADQLHRNVEAYVDDVVIKTRNPEGLIADLEETFNSLRKFRWKLNPKSASSEYCQGNCSGSLSATEALKLILKKSQPLLTWRLLPQSKMCRNQQDAWQLSTGSSPDSGREDYPFSNS